MKRFKKLAIIGVGVVAPIAFGGGFQLSHTAASDTDDYYSTNGSTHYNGSTTVGVQSITDLVFTVGGLTDTCTNSTSSIVPPASGLGKVNATAPTFNDGPGNPCTDNAHGTDTTATSGKWQFKEADKDGTAGENASEPNTGDKLTIYVPIDGAVVTNSLGCTITVNPDASLDPTDGYKTPEPVSASYDDVHIFKVKVSNIRVFVQGPASCPDAGASGVHASFTGNYQLSMQVTDAS
jgi:hypothetical protein